MPTNVTTATPAMATEWSASWAGGDPAAYPAEEFTMKCVTRGDTDGCMANNGVSSDPIGRNPGSEQSGTLTGLTPGKRYDCYVMVENEVSTTCSEKVEYTTAPGVPTDLLLLPVESEPMFRKIAWTNPSYPNNQESIASASITCCFDFPAISGAGVNVCNTQEFSSTWISDANFDFTYFVSLDASSYSFLWTTAEVRRQGMLMYSNNNYNCTVSVCNIDDACSVVSDPAEVGCPSNEALLGHWTPTGVSGNPLNDGWFKVGPVRKLGTWINGFDENTDAYGDSDFDLFVTTFTMDGNEILGVGGRLEDFYTENGDAQYQVDIIGIAVDPVPSDDFLPAIYTDYSDYLEGGSDYSGECLPGRFTLAYFPNSRSIVSFYYFDACSVSTSPDSFPESDYLVEIGESSDYQNFEVYFNLSAITQYTDIPIKNGWKVQVGVAQNDNFDSASGGLAFSLPYCTNEGDTPPIGTPIGTGQPA